MRIPVPAAITLFIISFLVDWLIWTDIRKYADRKVWSRIYAISSVACWAFLLVTLLLPRRDLDSDIQSLMWMLYSYITVYFAKLIYVIFSLLGRIPQIWKSHRINSGLWVGMPLGLLVFIAMWYGVIVTRHEVEVNHVEISSPRIPKSFNGYTIAQFSDAHVGTWGKDTTFISNLVDSINNLHPDLIVFTGDIVNRHTPELEPFLHVLSRLNAKDGVVSVLGNHDYGNYADWKSQNEQDANNALLAIWQRQMGWQLMNNTHRFLVNGTDTIALIGVENWGEPPFHQYGRLEDAYPMSKDSIHNLNDDKYKILLSHNPEHWNREVSHTTNIDLTLSGHTHAMQFMISLGNWKWSPSKYRYPQWAGLYERIAPDGTPSKLYVNIGCGEVAMPFRVGATPEITLFTLKSLQSKSPSTKSPSTKK